MERQKITGAVKYQGDPYTDALIAAAVENINNNYTYCGISTSLNEEGIPTPTENPYKKEAPLDDFSTKDPKASAAPGDVKKPSSQKMYGAGIEDTTKKVVATEGYKTCEECHGDGCSHCDDKGKHSVKESSCGSSSAPAAPKKKEKKVAKEDVLTYEFELDGYTYVFEADKKKGLDGKACWKGYKQMGTKMKGGKRVDNCVKAGFEPEGEILEKKLDPVGQEDKDIDNDGDHDKSDKYLLARRKKVSKILAAKKKVKEEKELTEKK